MKAVGKREASIPTYVSGETVNGGDYRCCSCDARHSVQKGRVVNLPVCPSCQGQLWKLSG